MKPRFLPTPPRVLLVLALFVVCAVASRPLFAQAVAAPAPAAANIAPASSATTSTTTPCPPLLRHNLPRLQDDKPQALCQYAGKVLLVVNTASFCGYTPQYEGLEALHAKYAARGLVVLGFPSNDFNQEAADSKKIAELCFNTYGVKFPIFASSAVKGPSANPVFAQLTKATGQAPSWNFNKYLVGRDGVPVAHYGSAVDPNQRGLQAAIEKLLDRRQVP